MYNFDHYLHAMYAHAWYIQSRYIYIYALRGGQESRLRPEKIADAVARYNSMPFPIVAVGTSRKLVFAQ